VVWVLVVLLVAAAGAGWYWFRPEKLFTNTTVNDTLSHPLPQASASATAPGPTLLSSGTLIAHEHATTGSVRVVRNPDGTRQLEVVDLDTSDGPDLHVWLTDQEVTSGADGWRVFDDGQYVELGKLKGNHGNQVYSIPADVDLSQYRSVAIWCKRFSVSFGAAELDPAPAG
jgi:hypothetical protein